MKTRLLALLTFTSSLFSAMAAYAHPGHEAAEGALLHQLSAPHLLVPLLIVLSAAVLLAVRLIRKRSLR